MNGFVSYLEVPSDILYFNYFLHDCHLLFFFLLPGGPGMNGLLSPPFSLLGPASKFSPGIAPMVASDTTFVPSVIPLTISVDIPLIIPIYTGCAVNVVASRVQSLCSPLQSFTMSLAPMSGFSGTKRKALFGTDNTPFLSRI